MNRGSILLSSLWILMILSLVSLGLMRRSMMESRSYQNFGDQMKARSLAFTGMRLAMARLAADVNPYDTLYECGIQLSGTEKPEDLFVWPSKEGQVRVGFEGERGWTAGMRDEDRKLNLNAAGEAALTALLMKAGGIRDLSAAREIAFAILDWKDEDHVDSGPLAAEDEYYYSLTHPYLCADRPFRVLEELTWVRGVTPELFENIRPYLTVYGPAFLRLNVHTASKPVLESAAAALGLSEASSQTLTEEIIRYREGPDQVEGTPDDRILLSLDSSDFHLSNEVIEGLTVAQRYFLTNTLKPDSNLFQVESVGRVDPGIAVTLSAVIFKTSGRNPELVSLRES